jgi:signal transduction histidine kinase
LRFISASDSGRQNEGKVIRKIPKITDFSNSNLVNVTSEEKAECNQTTRELEQPAINQKQIKEVIEESARLSHDLSQPLTYLIGSLELCQYGEPLSTEDCDKMLEAAIQMQAELKRFRSLIKQLGI